MSKRVVCNHATAALAVLGIGAGLCAAPATVFALGGPSPGAATAQTVKLPAGPGSVRGLADNAQVSGFTGQVEYAVPIDLPAGPGGLVPALSLGYDGDLGNGPLGVGWALSQPGIRRSLRLGVPSYTATDELELVGMGAGGQLVALADGSYRAEGRGNSIIGRAVDGGFELVGADGKVYRFGTSAAGRKASGTRVAAWYLEQIRDVAGQTIDYRYRQDRGEVYLDAIAWGPAVGADRAFRAELVYQDRSDAVVSYRTGFRVESAQRLAQIRLWSFGAVSRVTALDYDGAFALSRLSGVRVTSADGADALPSLAFRYAGAVTGAVTAVPDVTGWALNQQGTSLFDVDGDGAMDLLRLLPTGHSYRRNLGGRFDAPRAIPGAAGASLDQVRLLDLTGDSGAELVWQQGSQWSVFQLTGDPASRSWSSLGSWGGAQNVPLSSVTVADLNGDYLMDVVSVSGSSIQVRMGTVTGLAAPVLRGAIDPLRTFIAPGNAATSFPDINGDGLADVVYLSTSAMFLYLGRGDGTFERYRDLAYPWTGTVPNAAIRLGDLNRDGLLDVAVVRAGNVEWYRGLANGTLDPAPVRITRPAGTDASVVVAVADANGNGSEDIVWSSDAGMWVLDLAGPTSAGMLLAIDNGLGQTQAFHYDASAQLAFAAAAAGAPWSTAMPVSIPVTSSERLTFASGDPARSTRLDVRDGIYDRGERRFLGFAQSTLTRPDPADPSGGEAPDQVVRHIQQFATGLGLDRVLRGQVTYERIEDGTGKVLRESTYTLAALAIDGLPAAEPRLRRAAVLQAVVRRSEGSATPVDIRTRYQHDGEGRVIEDDADGRIDLAGDESIRRRRYTAADPVTGVRDLVCEEEVLGADGVSAGKTRRLYGDDLQIAPLCQAGKGWSREEQGYLSDGDRWVAQRRTAYDAAGNAISMSSGGVTRLIGYDSYRQFAVSETVTPEAGRDLTWRMAWDTTLGRPRQLTSPDGAVTTASYDGLGRLTALASGSAPPHVVYRYQWSAPRPRTETFAFDGDPAALGPVPASWTPGAGWRHTVELTNSAGEPWLAAVQLDSARWIVSGLRTRDSHGRTIAIADTLYADGTDPAALALPAHPPAQTAAYDALDRAVLQALPSGTLKRIVYTPLGVTTQTDGLAAVATQIDGLGRAIRTERTVDGTVESIDASYDAAGRVLRYRLQGGAADHVFTYDTLGRLVHAHDPDIGDRWMTYDDTGALTRSVNGAGEPIDYAYDGAGRLLSVTADGAPVRFHYDQPRSAGYSFTAGRLAWVEEATGTVDLGYDAAGRRTVFHRSVVDGAATADVTETQTLSPSGLVLSVAFDDGVTVPLGYDAAGRVVRTGNDWVLDDQTAAGDPMAEHFGNGVVQSYERDVLRQPTRIRIARSAQALYDVAIGHGAFGAISSVTDGDGTGLDHTASFAYDGGGRLTAASIGAAGPAQFQFSFAYDGLQNMVRRTVSGPAQLGVLAGRYEYGGSGPRQLTRVAAIADGATVASFAYDAAGRQTRHAGKTLRYNALSQLIRVEGLATGSVEHRYGYDGERVVTRDSHGASYWLTPDLVEANGQRDHYVRIHGRAVARITLGAGSSGSAAAGVTATRTVTGLLRGGAIALVALLLIALATPVRTRRRPVWLTRASYLALIALLAPGCTGGGLGTSASAIAWQTTRKLYFHQGVGAGPSLVTDAAAAVYEERRYEPFGEAIDAYRETGGIAAVDYRRESLNGLNKPSDPDSDMSYHGARWLPSDTAQWLTPDPPVKAPSEKFQLEFWALHPYQYVHQNPIAYWDPDGNSPDVIDRTNDVDPIDHKTFSTDDISRLRDFFVDNAAHPAPAGGTSGNTDPNKRYSCIGTMNHGIEKLFDKDLWTGNGQKEVDKTQDLMTKKGMTLGEAKVKYKWDKTAGEAVAKKSDWDTVLKLSKGDQGWSVYLVSVAGGYHSITVTLDNRDTDNPVMIISDQNRGSQGWRAYDNKDDFDAAMKDWQTSGGNYYLGKDLDPPPVGARYVRLRPE